MALKAPWSKRRPGVEATPDAPVEAASAPRRPRGRRSFVLGLGAQKAGTTWLYAYLRRSRRFAHGYRKEYHVFDSLDLPSEQWMRDRILGMAHEELEKARRGEAADAEQLHRASMYADPSFYYDYFAGLLASKKRYTVTGDLTPDYGLLTEERLSDIKDQFARRRVRTVAVCLLRDPVDRIYSQVRMQQGRRPARFAKPAAEMLEELFTEPVYEQRSRYEVTLGAMDAVFAPDERYVGLYEELFDEAEIQAVCDLVGIPFHAPDFDQRRNASRVQADGGPPESVVRMMAQHFRPTYEAVAERFPDKDLTAVWPYARHAL